MQWYYSANGRQQGPVSLAELEALVRAGTVEADALVWHEGMKDWAAYNMIAAGPAGIPAHVPQLPGTVSLLGDGALCVECGQTFPKDSVVAFQDVHVCAGCKPRFFQKLREGVSTGGAGLWSDKRRLVTMLDPVLPPRCVKCNAPTDIPQKKCQVYWHSPVVYLAIFLNLIIYVIVAMIVRKRSTVMVSICKEHRVKRRNAIITGWVLALLGIGAFISAFLVPGVADKGSWLIIPSVVLFLGGIIYGVIKGRLIYATKIDKERVWLGGCGPKFLAGLPEWTGV